MEVPADIHEQYLKKGTGRQELVRLLLQADGNKDRSN